MPLMTEKKTRLINEDYGTKFKEHYLEQYKLFVDSAEKVSSKRMISNNFYLLVNSALFGVAGYMSFISKTYLAIILSVIGILLCIAWMLSITSYKELNSAKFKIILAIEQYLPLRLFKKEDEILSSHYSITKIEKYIPAFFILLYCSILGFILLKLFII